MKRSKSPKTEASVKGKSAKKLPIVLEPEVLLPEAEESENNEDSEAENTEETEHEGPTEADIEASLPAIAEEGVSDLARSVSATDPLRQYINEVRKYPLLDAHEEMALVRKLQEQGDINAAKALVSANLRLVVKIAMEYRSMYSNVMDLIQEGNIGLMKAVSKYDPTKGARMGYYASWWIRSYILKYLLDNFRLVKIGTTQAQKKLFYHLMREKERLESQGLLAGPKLLAERLNVREKDVIEMEHRLSGRGAEVSLDIPVDGDGERSPSHVSLLADEKETPEESLARNEMLSLLRDKLPEFEKQLNDKEKRLLHDRLLAEEPQTLQEVADHYGLTRERARQIEAKLIFKLREFLQPLL